MTPSASAPSRARRPDFEVGATMILPFYPRNYPRNDHARLQRYAQDDARHEAAKTSPSPLKAGSDVETISTPSLGPRQDDDPADQVGRRFQERMRFTKAVQRKARRDARAALP